MKATRASRHHSEPHIFIIDNSLGYFLCIVVHVINLLKHYQIREASNLSRQHLEQ
jgi:hypothetical protein